MPHRTLIVYIDPDFATYLPCLKPAAEAHHFRLLVAGNVNEGIKTIEMQRSAVRVVILAPTQSEGNIEMKEAISSIKAIEPRMRVVILDSDDSREKLGDWFEYSRLGASMCFSKRWLDPMNLFATIRNPMGPWIETRKYEELFGSMKDKLILVARTNGQILEIDIQKAFSK